MNKLTTPRCDSGTVHKDVDYDVVFIGAGITGLMVAHTLAENGFKVGVFEAKSALAKASQRTSRR
ncbi:hypothetical protein B9Q13_01800 [Candidatus Marsarchaeota G2 archaeon ECH_B_SAG-G16]|uniref:FAD dependent oxidoreductase domain-containing protein n=1 Tax=Candidatus Marsarchaeota G2 archaeon ECH_B_SAG-G16 TaxID=1978167 RepID=A0A2R6C3M5_9ARCH|nr:MAG: hypothetical protein B9Q13_01800 [Candidatus Marsarchaeota G2 archaeon ECH_B_SAG-G16]